MANKPIEWHTEKRSLSDLKTMEGNPRRATEKQVEDLTRSLKHFNLAAPLIINIMIKRFYYYDKNGVRKSTLKYLKHCEHCNKEFWLTKYYFKRRKYCSRKCWSHHCAENLGEWTNSEKIAERNKKIGFRKSVSRGLKEYYERHYFNRLERKDNFDYGWTGWKILRKEILNRDKVCQRCGSEKNLRIHHIIPVRAGGKHNPENLITLCNNCHQLIEKNQLGIYNIVNDWETTRILFLDSLLSKRMIIDRWEKFTKEKAKRIE